MTLFRQEALDHKRRKLFGEVILVQPVSFYVMTALMAVLTAVIVGFLALGEYKRKETVLGYLSPEGGVTVLRAEQGGRLTTSFVMNGESVAKGQALFEVSRDVENQNGGLALGRIEAAEQRIIDLTAQKENVRRRYRDDRFRLETQGSTLEREVSDIRARLDLQKQALQSAEDELERIRPAAEKGVISSIQFERTKRAVIDQQIVLRTTEQQLGSREGALADNRASLSGLAAREQQELDQIDFQIKQVEETILTLSVERSYIIRSPVNGVVANIQGAQGQSLIPSLPLITIIPDDAILSATLLAPTRASGFLAPGQDVNLLIDAFPYQKFGVQKGVITSISSSPYKPGELDAPVVFEQPVYKIEVSLVKDTVLAYGEEVPLKPGMTLQGDLVIDERSLLEWMLDPLFTLNRN